MGRLTDENATPLVGFDVSVQEPGNLWGSEIGHQATDDQGNVDFTYISDSWAPRVGPRELEIVVADKVRREILRVKKDDPTTDELSVGTLVIPRADLDGVLVTLGTGTPQLVSRDNAISVKNDQDAFAHVAKLFHEAEHTIFVTQLEYKLPEKFFEDATKEKPATMFAFHDPQLDAANLRKPRPDDQRAERLMIEAADKGVEIRILLHEMKVPLFVRILAGAILMPLIGSDGFFAADRWLRSKLTDLLDVQAYFEASGRTVNAHSFAQPLLNGVFHNKLVLVDNARAISIGSPYKQNYNDSHDHFIDAPRRGRESEGPRHDAGFAFTGPAVADLHATLTTYWNTSVDNDPLPPLEGTPVAAPEDGDVMTSLQLVRTLSAETFPGKSAGEKGILEAYLRAIANADDFIYLETQYFTDDNIGHALVEAMKLKPDLQVIMLVNIKPDVPTYPFKQRRLITRIRKGIKDHHPERFGVFTRWTHEVGLPRPRMLPVYLHAKLGVVDDTWATVGSANLDGLSLDSSLLSDYVAKIFPIREQRAIELNGVMLNGVADHPASQSVSLVRRTDWAEHLGFVVPPGQPDAGSLLIDSDELVNRPAGGWLDLWRSRAKAMLDQLIADPTASQVNLGRVLPWPDDDSTHSSPRHHLDALQVKTYKVVPLKETRAFQFFEGDWDPKTPAAVMDYD